MRVLPYKAWVRVQSGHASKVSAVVFALLLAGCGGSTAGKSHAAAVAQTTTQPLAISPTTSEIVIGETASFTGSGGAGSLTYSVFMGGGSVDSSGLYTAPGSAGVATVRVTDSLGATADASVTIDPALTISPTPITVAINNSQTF